MCILISVLNGIKSMLGIRLLLDAPYHIMQAKFLAEYIAFITVHFHKICINNILNEN